MYHSLYRTHVLLDMYTCIYLLIYICNIKVLPTSCFNHSSAVNVLRTAFQSKHTFAVMHTHMYRYTHIRLKCVCMIHFKSTQASKNTLFSPILIRVTMYTRGCYLLYVGMILSWELFSIYSTLYLRMNRQFAWPTPMEEYQKARL